MAKIFKKLILAGAVGFVAVSWLKHTTVGSYARQALQEARSSVKKQITVESQLARVEGEIGRLEIDVDDAKSQLARQLALIARLETEQAEVTRSLKAIELQGKLATEDLAKDQPRYSYQGKDYSREQLEKYLQQTMADYRVSKRSVQAREKQLDAHRETASLFREQLGTLVHQRTELQTRVIELRARVQEIRLSETRSARHVDDSRLADIQATLAEIENDLAVRQQKLALDGQYATPRIPVESRVKAAPRATVDEARELFGVQGEWAEAGVVEKHTQTTGR